MSNLIFACVVLLAASAMAQYRPFYAGLGPYPRPSNGGGQDDGGLGNRGSFDVINSRLDAFGHDRVVVQEASKLPDDRKPFWLLNREHIIRHIGLNPADAQPLRSSQRI